MITRRRLAAFAGVYGSVALGLATSLVILRVLHPAGAGRFTIVVGLADFLAQLVWLTSDDALERIIEAGGRRADIYRSLRDLRDRVADRVRAEYPDIPRRVSGYNLDELLPERGFHVARALVGSEGTCADCSLPLMVM